MGINLAAIFPVQTQIRNMLDEQTGRATAQRILENRPYVMDPLPKFPDYHSMSSYEKMGALTPKKFY